mmetsp:Transcript_21784/g.44101  ORF Transcript_21784/g.44101 Transcript_21784/m.44101 type:complete len:228 (+) Transcript_21784:204-887(+)
MMLLRSDGLPTGVLRAGVPELGSAALRHQVEVEDQGCAGERVVEAEAGAREPPDAVGDAEALRRQAEGAVGAYAPADDVPEAVAADPLLEGGGHAREHEGGDGGAAEHCRLQHRGSQREVPDGHEEHDGCPIDVGLSVHGAVAAPDVDEVGQAARRHGAEVGDREHWVQEELQQGALGVRRRHCTQNANLDRDEGTRCHAKAERRQAHDRVRVPMMRRHEAYAQNLL